MKKINEELYVGPQIFPHDVKFLSNNGIKSIICNRPDKEGEGQPDFSEIVDLASKLNIKTSYIPYSSRQMSDGDVKEFAKALDQLPKPIFAFCLGGVRSEQIANAAYKLLKD